MQRQARVFQRQPVDREGGVEAPHVIRGCAEQDLRMSCLVAELGEGGVARSNAGRDQFLMSESPLGRSQRGHGRLRNAYLRIEGRKAHEGGAHQQADRGDQRDEQKTAENQSLVETRAWVETDAIP